MITTPRAERWENTLQVALMLGVGAAAAAVSWSHVLDLARVNGQEGWRAWVVAACTETAAVSAGLEVRRRHRAGLGAALPLLVMLGSVVLQLAAQVAGAHQTPWGITLAVVPAVVFLLLTKLALSRSDRSAPIATPIATGSIDRIDPTSIDPVIDPVHSIDRPPIAPPIDPIGSIDPDPIDDGSIDPIEPTPIDRPGRGRSIEQLRSEFDQLVKDGQLRADASVEATRKALNCAPSRARTVLRERKSA